MEQILYAFSFLAQLFLLPLDHLAELLVNFCFLSTVPPLSVSISGILSLIQSIGHPVWLPSDSVGFECFQDFNDSVFVCSALLLSFSSMLLTFTGTPDCGLVFISCGKST